jgi:ankyrin repeat protein
MEAASGGHGEIIDFLLDRGVELDTQDAHGNSALMYAAFNDRANCIELLLKRSANKALTNRAGETASEIATKRKFARIVKLLLL